jgi:hypothetical protein
MGKQWIDPLAQLGVLIGAITSTVVRFQHTIFRIKGQRIDLIVNLSFVPGTSGYLVSHNNSTDQNERGSRHQNQRVHRGDVRVPSIDRLFATLAASIRIRIRNRNRILPVLPFFQRENGSALVKDPTT